MITEIIFLLVIGTITLLAGQSSVVFTIRDMILRHEISKEKDEFFGIKPSDITFSALLLLMGMMFILSALFCMMKISL